LKNIWTAPLPPETELSRQMTTSTTSIDIMGLQAAYANLHTDQERDYFMQRYHDVISSFRGKTSYDSDNRPLLVMRSNLWASGYDVDGTDQTSLSQFSGRVQQTYKHSVPRFFVPEHGTMFTLSFFFNPPATTEIYTLSLHDALPIFYAAALRCSRSTRTRSTSAAANTRIRFNVRLAGKTPARSSCRTHVSETFSARATSPVVSSRSEEHTSELQSQSNLVCRLLLEKK